MKIQDRVVLIVARIICQLIYFSSRLLRLGEGTTFPGKMIIKIFPNLLNKLIPRFRNGWILITGTNGKTTTTKIITEVMRGLGYSVCTNICGANLLSGIVTGILLTPFKFNKEFLADYAIFEIDEAILIKSFNQFKPQILVVTNFSRDQLDRYGEIDTNVNRLINLLKGSDCRVVLSGNDPNAARIGSVVKPENRFYFGITDGINYSESGLLLEKDTGIGPGEMGLPLLQLQAGKIKTEYLNGSNFELRYEDTVFQMNTELPGIFNVLNVLAAIGVCLTLGLELTMVSPLICKIKSCNGRSEQFKYRNISVFLFLVKNPVGFNHVIKLLSQARGIKRILFLLNDLTADGNDVSWIWDVALENLWMDSGIKEIVTSGTRAGDMALRIKYSNQPQLPIVVDYLTKRAFYQLTQRMNQEEDLIILANYTAMNRFRPFLARVSAKKAH